MVLCAPSRHHEVSSIYFSVISRGSPSIGRDLRALFRHGAQGSYRWCAGAGARSRCRQATRRATEPAQVVAVSLNLRRVCDNAWCGSPRTNHDAMNGSSPSGVCDRRAEVCRPASEIGFHERPSRKRYRLHHRHSQCNNYPVKDIYVDLPESLHDRLSIVASIGPSARPSLLSIGQRHPRSRPALIARPTSSEHSPTRLRGKGDIRRISRRDPS